MVVRDLLTPRQRENIERAATLKGKLVDFALQPHLQRPLREHQRRVRNEQLGREFQLIEAIETLLFEHRFDNGTTVLDRFDDKNPGLGDEERDLLAAWSDSVHGIFEVGSKESDVLRTANLFDDLAYTCVANGGADSIRDIDEGDFVITRILRVNDLWMLSGTQARFDADEREGIATTVAQRAIERPELITRNPEYRRSAERIAAALYENFVEYFGDDMAVVPGEEFETRYGEFLTFNARRSTSDADVIARQKLIARAIAEESGLYEARTVGMHCDPLLGPSFYAEFGAVSAVFDEPDRADDQEQRELVRGYIDDDTIPAQLIVRLAERCPDADAVFAKVLGRKHFNWERDGESLLRQRKPGHFAHPRSSGVTVLPKIALEHYRQLQQ